MNNTHASKLPVTSLVTDLRTEAREIGQPHVYVSELLDEAANRIERAGSQLEADRRALWIDVATAVARAEDCKNRERPAQWADAALKAFDERFGVKS